jgi:hypothetical protein
VNVAYHNATADHGAPLITHIALINNVGTEISDARLAVAWTTATSGLIRPTANLDFSVPESSNVAGWRGWGESP